MLAYRIKRHFSIIAHSPDNIEFRFGVWNPLSYHVGDSTGSGKLLSIIQALDGTRSSKEIAQEASVNRTEVEAVIDHLLTLDIVENAPTHALDTYLDKIQSPFYRSEPALDKELPMILLGAEHLQHKVREQLNIKLLSVPENDACWRMLSDTDISWLDDGLQFQERMEAFREWKDHLVVVVMELINPLTYRVVNRVMQELGTPWIHACLDGPFIFVGPTFIPGTTACYECLEKRILMNLKEAKNYIDYKNLLSAGKVKMGKMPHGYAIDGILASHLAFEIMNLRLAGNNFTRNKMLSIYLPTMEMAFNEVLKVPGCPVCGSSLEKDHFELHFEMGMVSPQITKA